MRALEHIKKLEESRESKSERYEFMNKKHTKKDYANMEQLSIKDIFNTMDVKAKKK